MRIHSAVKDFKCETCKTKFAQIQALNKHVKMVHLKQNKKVACELCDKDYSSNGDLLSHLALVHGQGETFQCKLCDKSLGSMRYLKAHVRRVHREKPSNALLKSGTVI